MPIPYRITPALAPAAIALSCSASPDRYQPLRDEADRYGAGAETGSETRRPALEEEVDPLAEAEKLRREDLVTAVLARNPSLEAARQAWIAATETVPSESALADPSVRYSVAPLSPFDRDVTFGHSIGLRQELPWPGLRSARGELALAEAEATRGRYLEVRLELARTAATLYDDYYRVARELEINREHIELFEEAQASARAEFEAGRASLQDPIQAEVEAAHIEHRRIDLEGERDEIAARINGLLHRDQARPLPPPPARRPIPPPVGASVRELVAVAFAERAELDRAEAEIRAGDAARAVADASDRPQFSVSADYNNMWPELSHQIMVGVDVSVPIWRSPRRADRDAAQARLERARAEREHIETEIAADVLAMHRRASETLHVVAHYRDEIIPAAGDRADAAHAAFVAGDLSFNALIEALTRLRDQEVEYEEHLARLYQRRAALERAVGYVPGLGDLPAAEAGHEEARDGHE